MGLWYKKLLFSPNLVCSLIKVWEKAILGDFLRFTTKRQICREPAKKHITRLVYLSLRILCSSEKIARLSTSWRPFSGPPSPSQINHQKNSQLSNIGFFLDQLCSNVKRCNLAAKSPHKRGLGRWVQHYHIWSSGCGKLGQT